MAKNNIRSIRFSDEIKDIIEEQVGNNFNEKFERLIYNCYMLKPQLDEKLKTIQSSIEEEHNHLYELRKEARSIKEKHISIMRNLNNYDTAINIAITNLTES